MTIDASATSRPVVIRVTDPSQINQAFDSITYDKVKTVNTVHVCSYVKPIQKFGEICF